MHRPVTRRRAVTFASLALAAGVAAGCGGRGAAAEPAPSRPSGPSASRQAVAPFAAFRAQPVVVAPVQRLRTEGAAAAAGWTGDDAQQRAALDAEIAFALRERGVEGWAMADDVERMRRRNPTAGVEPRALAVEPLLAPGREADVPGPLASQLRALVALGGQRYVLVPSELRMVRLADGRAQAALHLTLVDARLARRLWSGEVRSDPASTFSRALLAGVADYLADLVSPRDPARPSGA